MQMMQSRRHFLASLSLAGAAGFMGVPKSYAAEERPETATIRLAKIPGICVAPQYAAEELLRAEGFSNIRYVEAAAGIPNSQKVAGGEIDFSMNFVGPLLVPMDAARRSRCWPAFILGVSSCSRTTASAASPT
jgi:NitT/TauT family transport system substrate-binding protein